MSSKLTDLTFAPSVADDDLLYLVPADGSTQYKVTVAQVNASGLKKYLTADFSNNTNTFANVADLTFNLENGGVYGFKGSFWIAATSGSGQKFDFQGGDITASTFIVSGLLHDSGGFQIWSPVTALTTTTLNNSTTNGTNTLLLEGVIFPSADGTFIPRMATNSGSNPLTLLKGSWLELTKFA